MIAPEYRPFVTYLGRRTDRPTITVEEVCDGDRAGALRELVRVVLVEVNR